MVRRFLRERKKEAEPGNKSGRGAVVCDRNEAFWMENYFPGQKKKKEKVFGRSGIPRKNALRYDHRNNAKYCIAGGTKLGNSDRKHTNMSKRRTVPTVFFLYGYVENGDDRYITYFIGRQDKGPKSHLSSCGVFLLKAKQFGAFAAVSSSIFFFLRY